METLLNKQIQEKCERLGISGNVSKKEIRRAYAKQLKNAHPEENPEEFVRLNQIYQELLSLLSRQEAKESAETSVFAAETEVLSPEPDRAVQTSQAVNQVLAYEEAQAVKEKQALEQAQSVNQEERVLSAVMMEKMTEWEAHFHQWFNTLRKAANEKNGSHTFVISPISVPKYKTYTRSFYQETEEAKKGVKELFADPEAEHLCQDERIKDYLLDVLKERILPESLAEALYGCYEKGASDQMAEKLLVYLMQNLTLYRRLPEYHCRIPFVYTNAHTDFIGTANLEFWEYLFAYGFGCRHALSDPLRTLTDYMEQLYQPSLEWRKEFTRFGKETPARYSFLLSDGTRFQAEFHLYYIRYFWNEDPVERICSFSRFCEEEKKGLTAEQFFLLLAVTEIREEERRLAKKLIFRYLELLPLYRPTLEVLSECLVNDSEPETLPENERKRVYLTLYEENERFCFRLQATPRKFTTDRYTKEGWVPVPLLSGEAKTYRALPDKERTAWLQKKIKQLLPPSPVLDRRISLEGKTAEEKIAALRAALWEYGRKKRIRRNGNDTPYVPSWPWKAEDLFPAVYDFFAEAGGNMTAGFVVLQIGTVRRPQFRRIFVVRMNIFGYEIEAQPPEIGQLAIQREQQAEKELAERNREARFLTVGRIGWGEDTAPYPIVIGESGSFYSFDEQRGLIKAESFDRLLGTLFDVEEVTAIELFEGMVTVSKLDRRLDYCYTEEDFQSYLNREKKLPTLFTEFRN